MEAAAKRNIYSWANVEVAKGYEKVLATWQGLYWQVRWEDLVHENLTEVLNTERGIRKWVTQGVAVYQFAENHKHILRYHRFAVLPPDGEPVCRGEIKADKYYIHVYQTKIDKGDGDLRTLNSREMA